MSWKGGTGQSKATLCTWPWLFYRAMLGFSARCAALVTTGGRQLGLAGLGWTLLSRVYSAVLIWELRCCCCFQFCCSGLVYKDTRAGAAEAGGEERRHRQPAAPATRPGESPHPIGTACSVPTRQHHPLFSSLPSLLRCWLLCLGAEGRLWYPVGACSSLRPSPCWGCCRSRSLLLLGQRWVFNCLVFLLNLCYI